MKYKVGDRVKYGSEICTVTKVLESQGKFKYRVQSDTWFDIVNEDEMIEGLVEEENNDCEKCGLTRNSTRCLFMDNCPHNKQKNIIEIPKDYVIKDENGNVINATKIVLEKKKKEYPKTYEECCKVLNTYCGSVCGYNWKLLLSFQQLLICRDAYWKIAGEEMGLGKPWKPDWTNEEWPDMYYISFDGKHIDKEKGYPCCNMILIFPTEEMRDAFKKNFDPDIEFCKEFL